ncbi:unnamed protein product [Heligmosomoides polygyrus]|uniref:3Beta_HSD domain-containing protein n=1 Tax=Heligmosomoides polygyrus TaxID=6339 RepID=A0A183GU92_HELPZ|nr:unnamed protein product [Heligmosomoides polygyrus]
MRRFLNGQMPAYPELNLACVDVRDVAKAHVEAMRCPESDGERILITSQPSFWFRDIARILGKEFRPQGYWVPHYQVPYILLWLYSFFDSEAAACLNRVGHLIRFDNSKVSASTYATDTSLKENALQVRIEMRLPRITMNVLTLPGDSPNGRCVLWK